MEGWLEVRALGEHIVWVLVCTCGHVHVTGWPGVHKGLTAHPVLLSSYLCTELWLALRSLVKGPHSLDTDTWYKWGAACCSAALYWPWAVRRYNGVCAWTQKPVQITLLWLTSWMTLGKQLNLRISLFISKLGVPMRIKWNNPEKVFGSIPDIWWTLDEWNSWRHPNPLAMRFRSNWVSVAQEKRQVGRTGRLGLTRGRLTAPKGADRSHCLLWQHELIKSIHQGWFTWASRNLERVPGVLCSSQPEECQKGMEVGSRVD